MSKEIIKEVGDKADMIKALLKAEFYDVEFNRGEDVVTFTAHNDLNEMLNVTLVLDSEHFNKEIYYLPARANGDPTLVESKGKLNIHDLDPDEVFEEWENSDYVEIFYENLGKIEVYKND